MGFFFFKQKTAYEMQRGLVGSEMCIRDRVSTQSTWESSDIANMPSTHELTNFRIYTYPLQEDQSLLICKTCGTYLTTFYSGPDAKKYLKEIPRVDLISKEYYYERILFLVEEILPTDDGEILFNKIQEQAAKRGDVEIQELCEKLMRHKEKNESGDEFLLQAKISTVSSYNKRVEINNKRNKKSEEIKGIDKKIKERMFKHMSKRKENKNNEPIENIISNIQCGIAVSYTHLTLPTILLVQISVVAVSLTKKKYQNQ
eukprot:TRINITY_DN1624_c0_g1_i1.p1 TRINITY_DN1624_c0_g1~~TRINITY_DN1624_c0_g1_i1.p1  ORF type:complete len:258 (+),score=85.16 TRINITY_DN1624_c0_g1_i1:87-860(+)